MIEQTNVFLSAQDTPTDPHVWISLDSGTLSLQFYRFFIVVLMLLLFIWIHTLPRIAIRREKIKEARKYVLQFLGASIMKTLKLQNVTTPSPSTQRTKHNTAATKTHRTSRGGGVARAF